MAYKYRCELVNITRVYRVLLMSWEKVDICGENEYCQNTIGSYDCFCKKGYELNDNVCKKKVLSERYANIEQTLTDISWVTTQLQNDKVSRVF